MDEKEATRKRLEKEIFETCKKENREPDGIDIQILLNLEEQRFFEKFHGIDKFILSRRKEKLDAERKTGIIDVTQKFSDLK